MLGFGKDKYKSKAGFPSEIILAAAVVFEILILLYFNFFHVKDGVDQDYASLLYHGMEMAKNHRLLLDNWIYSSTAELDSPMLLAALFMVVIKNPYYSFALANTVNIILFAIVLNRLLENAGATLRTKLLAAAFVFTSYDLGILHYTNMMFIRGGQFFVKAFLPLLLMTILSMPEDKRKSKGTLTYEILFYLTALIAVFSSGLSVFVTCFLPVIVCAFFYLVFFNENKKTTDKRYYLIQVGLTIAVSLAGVLLEKICGLHSKAETFEIRREMYFTEALVETIGDMFSCLRTFLQYPTSAMSLEGLTVPIRWCVIALFFVGFASLYRSFGIHVFGKNKDGVTTRDFIKASLVTVFITTFIILVMTKSRGRYHVPGVVAIMIVAAMNLEEYAGGIKETARDAFYIFCGFLFIADSIGNIKFDARHWMAGEKSEYLVNFEANEQIKQVLDEYGVEMAYTAQNNQLRAGMQLVDPDRIYYMYGGSGDIGNSWDQYTPLEYMDNSVLPAKNAFVDSNMDIVPDYIKQNYIYVGPIGPYHVLISDYNPLDPQCIIDPDRQTVDLPSNPHYEKIGEIDKFGYLSTTEEGNVLQSPGIDAPCAFSYEAGYEWDGNGTISCDIYKNGEFYLSNPLESGNNKLQITFEEPGNYMFVFFKQGDGQLTVKEMYFEGIK